MVNDFKSVQRQTAQYDLFNRLHSIAGDEAFVRSVAEHYGGRYEKSLEAIRVKAEDQPISDAGRGTATQASNTYAYFKSTDGHTGTWNFNLRRSNLPLASRLDQNGGYVQTLRAGGQTAGRKLNGQDDIGRFHPKREVINRAIARTANHTADWDTGLHLPPMIPPTERSQIEEKLESWVDALCASSLTLPSLSKPLRPFWIHPATRTPPTIEPDAPFTPVICVSASKWVGSEDDVPAVTRVQGGRTVGFSYVQGAGDDDELWSRGLSPAVYYQNKAGILEADKDDLAGVVDELVSLARTDKLSQAVQSLNITDSSVSTEPLLDLIGVPTPHSRLAVQIGPPISPTPAWTPQYRRKPLSSPNTHTIRVVLADKQRHPSFTYAYGKGTSVFACPSARAEPKAYGMALDELVDHLDGVMEREDGVGIVLVPGVDTDVKAARQLQERPGDPKSKTGDVEVDDDVLALPPANPTQERMLDYRRTIIPIALVLLLSNPNLLDLEDASHGIDTQKITKKDIGDMLHRLVALWPDGNPPRAALKRVNEYLMSPYA